MVLWGNTTAEKSLIIFFYRTECEDGVTGWHVAVIASAYSPIILYGNWNRRWAS